MATAGCEATGAEAVTAAGTVAAPPDITARLELVVAPLVKVGVTGAGAGAEVAAAVVIGAPAGAGVTAGAG
ncbi:MAG TPA: hypothetical protein PLL44_09030, partial [Novosphingobium sp.]|nr:hypothetical protein [Novosphingobium sp.]